MKGSVSVTNCAEPLTNAGFSVNSVKVIGVPTCLYLKSKDEVVCSDPETIPPGLFAMLSHVVCVILPLNTYLASYEDVSCAEELITPLDAEMWPVISKVPLIVILLSVWVIIESPIWSSPTATIILPGVICTSSPNEPEFFGPEINTALIADSAPPNGCWYSQLLFSESQYNEPLAPAPLPESWTDIPPKRTAGVSVLSITLFVPILTEEPVMFWSEEEPCTIKSWVT